MRRDVFQAIADPNRRAIIHLLSKKKATISEVAGDFDMSLVAVSKHLKILEECGLLTFEQVGREKYCEAKLDPLIEVSTWVNKYQAFWDNKLKSLKTLMEQKPNKKTKSR